MAGARAKPGDWDNDNLLRQEGKLRWRHTFLAASKGRFHPALTNCQWLQIAFPAKGRAGDHRVVLTVRADSKLQRVEQPIKILAASTRSTGRLGGAWVDIYHHDEAEGKPFNAELGQMTDTQWRERWFVLCTRSNRTSWS